MPDPTPSSDMPSSEPPKSPESQIDLMRKLRDEIETLVASRAGEPIYEETEKKQSTTIAPHPENSTLTIAAELTPRIRHIKGVVLPTANTMQFVLLGIDGSAILYELKKMMFIDSALEALSTNGGGVDVFSESDERYKPIVYQAIKRFPIDGGKVLLDIQDDPQKMIEQIRVATDMAKQKAQQREQNLMQALPSVITILGSYGPQNP